MDVKNFIGIYDNALSKDECKYIVDFFNNSEICANNNEFVCRKDEEQEVVLIKRLKILPTLP